MERDDIVGTWVYESGAGNAKSGRLVFRADGTFTARMLPFFPVLGSDAESTTTSGVGTWTMKGTRWERELSLQFKELSGRPEIVGGLQTYLVCQGKGTSGRLFYFVGDPDQNERIVYRRAAIGGK